MSAISSGVSAVARRLPVAMETLCGMLRDFEQVFNTDQRRLGLILNSMLADSKNSSLLSLIARFTSCERRVCLNFSDSDGCNLSFLRTVFLFLDKIDNGTSEPGQRVSTSLSLGWNIVFYRSKK